jgi:hypothetical protein
MYLQTSGSPQKSGGLQIANQQSFTTFGKLHISNKNYLSPQICGVAICGPPTSDHYKEILLPYNLCITGCKS